MAPMELMNLINSGGNPQTIIQEMARTNPIMQRALEMSQGKSPQQLMSIARNIAQQRGIDGNQFMQMLNQFGLRL